MRSAPPVFVPVGRFVMGWAIAAGLALLSVCAGGVWLWHMEVWHQADSLMLMWLLLSAACAILLRRESWPSGRLGWDGEVWRFELGRQGGPAVAVHVVRVWDGGRRLCLRLKPVDSDEGYARAGFVWLRALDMPGQWHSLRCALAASDTL